MSKNKEKISKCIVELKEMMIDLRDTLDENSNFIMKMDEDLKVNENVKFIKEVVSEALLKQKEEKRNRINLDKLYKNDLYDEELLNQNKSHLSEMKIDCSKASNKFEKENLVNIADNLDKHISHRSKNTKNKKDSNSNIAVNNGNAIKMNNLNYNNSNHDHINASHSEDVIIEMDEIKLKSEKNVNKSNISDDVSVLESYDVKRDKIEKIISQDSDLEEINNKVKRNSDDESSEV